MATNSITFPHTDLKNIQRGQSSVMKEDRKSIVTPNSTSRVTENNLYQIG